MALPDSAKIVDGSTFVLAHNADWGTGSILTGWGNEDYEMDLTSLASDGYRESPKIDLTANRDMVYELEMAVEMATDPTAGETIDIYAGFSASATADTGNPGNLVGADGAYSGYSGGTAANGVKNLLFIGSLVLDALNDLDDVQVATIGQFIPTERYMCLVVHNNSSVALHSVMDETAIRISGKTYQIQD